VDSQPGRSEYKKVWSALSTTPDQAKLHVIGVTDEEALRATGEQTLGFLQESVGIREDDVVLEIGCGIGRVGRMVAPLCRKWIGCDVASNMLSLAAKRLRDLSNVQLQEISGYNLSGVADASVDVVYCTVVFMHLESWDRYNYIIEALRVLRPKGRIYVDNINLCSDGGWKVFEIHRAMCSTNRPAHMTQNSTPQEIQTYLERAGFSDVQIRTNDDWVRASGIKPESLANS
jgi:ubiquinone/menaquinone biosynthesis C-methylase UbiE